jgi:SAM-dependent methyltransferase
VGLNSSAAAEGAEWGARAAAWAEHCAPSGAPAWAAVADAARIGSGTRVLDVGCGSGEFCALAAGRGATVSGLDAAEGMIAIACERVPGADLRVGAMEALPWGDGAFDVVTGFNSFQFAADAVVALREARRVTRSVVAACTWGEVRELFAVLGPLGELGPPAPPSPPRPVVEELLRPAGLAPGAAGEVAVPFVARDLASLEHALVAGAGFGSAVEHSGAEAVRRTIAETAAPFRQPDGSYRFDNRFRYVIARKEE